MSPEPVCEGVVMPRIELALGFAMPRISRVRQARERRGGDRVLLQVGLVT
jgi:hypothetical protein